MSDESYWAIQATASTYCLFVLNCFQSGLQSLEKPIMKEILLWLPGMYNTSMGPFTLRTVQSTIMM